MSQRRWVRWVPLMCAGVLGGCSADGGADVIGTGADASVDTGTSLEEDVLEADVMGGSEDTGVAVEPGPPAPRAYSLGSCPALAAGTSTFASGGLDRTIEVFLPADPEGAGVLFLWHGFGDTPKNFSAALGAAAIAKKYNVITVAPQAAVDPLESKKLAPFKELAASLGQLPPTWSILDEPELDMTLFDDLLACADEAWGIDRKRVYSMGFSQGGIWTGVLVMERSAQIAAAVSWSGGLGTAGGLVEVVNLPYQTPERAIPVLLAAGGATDIWPNPQLALVNFLTGSEALRDALRTDGHTVVFCDHGKGHTIVGNGLTWGLEFLFGHEWTEDGASPYADHDGSGFPEYCTF